MKICFAGPAGSAHIIKWCNWFQSHGHETHVISFTKGVIPGTQIHLIDADVDTEGSDVSKLKYLFTGKQIRKIIDEIKPDVVNAHYATSYGVAMGLSGLKGYVLSVWGSDIYDFPNKSPLHKMLLKYSLKKAGHLFSTSNAMAVEASKYTGRSFLITPFGVDMNLFHPDQRSRTANLPFTVGVVKTLSVIYGIDVLLKAAAIVKQECPETDLSLRICGDGPDMAEFQKLAEDLGIADITLFPGRITQEEAAREWADMDVAVIPSVRYESFGVAAVEAQACSIPVIVSDVEGLMETTIPGQSSIVVPRKDEKAVADALIRLWREPALRKQMGEEGRKYVLEKYELDCCFKKIEQYFEGFVS